MYQPGKEMLLDDALSHLPSRANNSEIKLDLWVNAISISAFSSSRVTKTANETQKDLILSTVHQLTLNGWPRIRRHVPRIAHNYWDFRDELSIEGNLLMKGERIVIATMCRDSILADLLKSQEGANRSLSLARTCVYWPGMEADIMDYMKRCMTCVNNAKMPVETLHPHEGPNQTMDETWYGFLPRWFRKQIFNRCRLFLQVPIHLSCHIDTPPQDAEIFKRSLLNWRRTSCCDDRQRTTLQWWRIQVLSLENSTSSTRHPHHISIIRMDSSRQWWRKWKPAYKKTDGSRNAQARALLQLCDTPLVKDLPSPAEILHGRSAHKELSCPDLTDPSTYRGYAEDF